MKVNILENTDNIVRFRLDEVSHTFANALRRLTITSVECFAVDTVTFYENSSAMFDEYIAHRIGLIPITTPKGYDEKDEILFSLEASGPCTIYSKDLKSSDKNVQVANENIPIMKLAEGQNLRVDAKAIMSNAKRSSKFQPGIITYNEVEGGKGFEFYVESFGQMPAIDIVTRALGITSNDIKEVHKELK